MKLTLNFPEIASLREQKIALDEAIHAAVFKRVLTCNHQNLVACESTDKMHSYQDRRLCLDCGLSEHPRWGTYLYLTSSLDKEPRSEVFLPRTTAEAIRRESTFYIQGYAWRSLEQKKITLADLIKQRGDLTKDQKVQDVD